MEKIGKHILQEIINGNFVELTQNELKSFPLEFHKQYKLLSQMRTQKLPISRTDLEVYAIYNNQEIDMTYPQLDLSINQNGEKLKDFIKLQISLKEKELRHEKMENLFSEYRKGNLEAGRLLYRQMSENLNNNKGGSVVSIDKYFNEQREFFDNMASGKELDGLILWGNGKQKTSQFKRLSNIIKRIARTDLVVIGARPSVGKTSFSLALMNALYKHDYKPMFISLEMTNGELMQRMATSKSNLSYDVLMSPNTEFTKEIIDNYMLGLGEVSQMDIKLIDNPPTSWLDLKKKMLEVVDEVDYYVIDHMHIISTYDGTPNNNKNQMYGEISRDMKLFARDYKKPIILLAQLSREVRSGGKRVEPSYVEPNMTDLRDSGSIEQDADKIFMLYRYAKGTDKEVEELIDKHKYYGNFPVRLKIDKNRAGALGYVDYVFNAKTGRWSEK